MSFRPSLRRSATSILRPLRPSRRLGDRRFAGAAGKACLSDEERELGVALVELGAGVTNVSVFAGGMLVGLKSLAMGGIDITDDIASAFGTRRGEAERMKCFYGSATTSPRDNHDMIDVNPVASQRRGRSPSASPARS
jgi:cell division protein FtsA